MKGEIKSLTGLRGIAAFYVMIFHFFNPIIDRIKNDHIFIITIKNVISKGYISVDLFFILSAFVLTLSYKNKIKTVNFENYKEYIIKRLIRIYPLYIIILILSFFLQKNLSFKFISSYITLNQSFFNNTALNGVNPSVWSLSTEFYAYLIFPFLLVLIINIKSKATDLFVCVLSLIILIVIQYLPIFYYDFEINHLRKIEFLSKNLDISIGYSAVLRTFISYILGVLFFKYINKFPNVNSVIISILIIVLIALNISDLLIYLSFFILIKSLLNQNIITSFLNSKYIYKLGLISYSLYLWHFIVLKIIEQSDILSHRIYILRFLAIGFSLILSLFTYYFIEEKSKNFLLNVFTKKSDK